MTHHYAAQYKNCLIRPVFEKDIEFLRIWRNNENLSRYLTPVGKITPAMQQSWYHRNLEDSNIITFAVEETQDYCRLVGSESLYDFKRTTAEVGKSMIGDDEARGKSLGFYSELMAAYFGFEKMGLEQIVTRIHEENQASMKRAHRLGYIMTGKHPFISGGYECDLICSKEQFYAAHPELTEIRFFDYAESAQC